MVKIKRVRTKQCSRCDQCHDVLYRVKIEPNGDWRFVCPACIDIVKPANQHYQYGGTWKSKKRH